MVRELKQPRDYMENLFQTILEVLGFHRQSFQFLDLRRMY